VNCARTVLEGDLGEMASYKGEAVHMVGLLCWSQLLISEEKMMLYKVAWELHIYWGMLTSLQLRR
jgi:hypothetical protein